MSQINTYHQIVMSLIATVLIVFNMVTFPDGPAEAGLIDAGPFLGLWMLIVYIWFAVIVFKKDK